MSTIDLSPRAFRIHTAQRLASSPTLRNDIINALLTRLSHPTIAVLGNALLRFAYVPQAEPFLLVQFEPQPATICHAAHWERLNEFCWEVLFLTGVCRLQISGSDLQCRCWLDAAGHWIRESL